MPWEEIISSIHRIDQCSKVPFPPAHLFELVADVESYPAFLPWCKSARVEARGEDFYDATLEVAKGPLRQSFTTRNNFERGRSISMRLLAGPFRRLEGQWRFIACSHDPGRCLVTLRLEFEFSNRVVGMVLSPAFGEIARSFISAFTRRAGEIYPQGASV